MNTRPNRSKGAYTLAGAAMVLALVGCVTLPGRLSLGGVLPVKPRPAADPPATAPEPRADAGEFPLVPLPPLKRTPPPTTAAAAVVPAANPAPVRVAQAPPAPLPPIPTPPAETPTPTEAPPKVEDARQLYQRSRAAYAQIDSYIARMTRRETVGTRDKPEEVILFKFRKEPFSFHMKWLGKEGQGREAVYVKDQFDNKLHTLLAAGDMPLTPAGKRLSLAVDSFLVKAASRHPVTDAGFGAMIDRVGRALDHQDRGDSRYGSVKLIGTVQRPDLGGRTVYAVEHDLPAGAEADLPKGGRRTYFFDPETWLPVLLTTTDDRKQPVEYYRYDRVQFPVKLDNADFDPDQLWAKNERTP